MYKVKKRLGKEALTLSYWEMSLAWRRPEKVTKQPTVEGALQKLGPIPAELGPKYKVSHLTLALVREIVHRQKEPTHAHPLSPKLTVVPSKAS